MCQRTSLWRDELPSTFVGVEAVLWVTARALGMKILLSITFIAAGLCALLSYFKVLPANSMITPIIFLIALVLTLLHLINTNDRRY